MTIHEFIDVHYGANGDERLKEMVAKGVDVDAVDGAFAETPLHVAARRCRPSAARILVEAGADKNARTAGGKTAYVHAWRRGFMDVAKVLADAGADTTLALADQFAVAVSRGRLDEAKKLLAAHPEVARTGNPEEDRLLADMAGRNASAPVEFLLSAGADITATALDDGTPLHQACWFGQPQNARLLIDAGAPLEVFDATHESSPLGWVTHGSRYSGGADERQDLYVELAEILLEAGASMYYLDDSSDAYFKRLLGDATPRVAAVLRRHRT